ncbi:hypothetical protein Tel_02205 [Candidatus Tenderia electrophaga]|jgi:hypothetical protein|uniref:Phytochrome sensor protein n=1 Tax=Candidatus Tenderia electrophaga TaxID=1748243 RepID=A0A0S2TA65_9GAMM|nr:hypothetical protein Tel_02205 [Candidatus Tenderia electrophaga]
MSSKQNSQPQGPAMIDAETIAEYLHQNPEFFEQNPDVLAELNISHQLSGAVSLIERQITTLREQNLKLKTQLENLIQIARDNDQLNERMHTLTLAVMDADSLNEIYIALDDSLRGEFGADAVTVKLFVDTAQADIDADNDLMQTIFVPMDDPRLDGFRQILGHEKPVCGALKPEQLGYMFGEVAEQIKSTALIPLGGEHCSARGCNYLGILAIGSHDERRFHTNMGTLFLSNLGEILSRAIRPYVADNK